MTFNLSLLFVLFTTSVCLGQNSPQLDADSTITYQVNNVYISTISSNSGISENGASGNITVRQGELKTSEFKADRYLVPLILENIKETTYFKNTKTARSNTSGYNLTISINVLGEYIEYQLTLKYDEDIMENRNFIIHPGDPNHPEIIKLEMLWLFRDHHSKNTAPVAKIRIDGQLYDNAVTIYRSNEDMIVFDGTSSFDENTPKEDFIYRWVIKKSNDSTAYLSGFSIDKPKQSLVIPEPGTYSISLTVSDGVLESKKITKRIQIDVRKKPHLEILSPNTQVSYQKCLLSRKKNSLINKVQPKYEFYLADLSHGTLALNYLYSTNSSGKLYLDYPSTPGKTLSNHEDTSANSSLSTLGVSVPGIKFPEQRIEAKDAIIAQLDKDLTPGVHTFQIQGQFNNVVSNSDTLSISYSEKSSLSFLIGYNHRTTIKGSDFYNKINLSTVLLGFRAYLFPRTSLDLNVNLPFERVSLSTFPNQQFSMANFNFALNYDILPWKIKSHYSNKPESYLTVFATYYNFLIYNTDIIELTGLNLYGLGIKPRIRLFSGKPNLGVLFLEGKVAYLSQFKPTPYRTWLVGLNLVYGLGSY